MCIRDRISFHRSEISEFDHDEPVDLAVSLHACDTATDDALARAVGWQAGVILAVPCCQHEFAGQLAIGDLAAVHRHGILHERLAALVTDALRAEAYRGLRAMLDVETTRLEQQLGPEFLEWGSG